MQNTLFKLADTLVKKIADPLNIKINKDAKRIIQNSVAHDFKEVVTRMKENKRRTKGKYPYFQLNDYRAGLKQKQRQRLCHAGFMNPKEFYIGPTPQRDVLLNKTRLKEFKKQWTDCKFQIAKFKL